VCLRTKKPRKTPLRYISVAVEVFALLPIVLGFRSSFFGVASPFNLVLGRGGEDDCISDSFVADGFRRIDGHPGN
jgi:hypothetical protein